MTVGKPGGADLSPRLDALRRYDILDTPPETGFDDIVALASQICETPVALVSLVADHRQWFKARIGFELCETPLSQSVCRHELDRPGLLTIPDLTLDPRTRDNALVTGEPHIRFYAGARLETPDGVALGRLCVIDGKPRPQGLTATQAKALEALARQTMALIEARRTAALRDEALKAVREADARHRQILESATDYAIITLDREGVVTGWNVGAERILGWTEPEMLGRPADVFFTAEDARAGIAAREMSEAREHGRGNDERWHQRKDGSRFWGLGEMMPLTAETGEHVGYLKILRDRTEQREAAEALRRQSDLLRTVTDRVSEAVFQLDTAGIVTFANPAAGTLLGWAADDLLGRNLHETAHYARPDGQPFPQEACEVMRALPAGLVLHNVEGVYFRRDGSPIDVLTSSAPVIEGGVIQGAVLTVVDVTLAKLANEELRRVDERLSFAMQASSAVGWWDWDIPADRVYASDSFARLYAVDPAVVAAGAPIAAFEAGIHPDDRDLFRASVAALIASGGEFAEEYRLQGPDGSVRWVYARGRCYRDEDGRPLRFPGVAVDITERRRGEQRQAALVELGDRLRELTGPAEIAVVASEIAGRTLGTASAAYGTVDQARGTFDVERDWCPDGVASIAGRRHFAAYGTYLDDLLRGEIVAVDNVETDPRTIAEPFRALGVRSLLNVPVMEHGRLVAVLCLLDTRSRLWSKGKLNFCRSVADRTRAALAKQRAEAAQELLNHELSHRMKNLLAMVLSIANQTMRSTTDVETARHVLSGRIMALSQAQDLLMGGKLGDTTIEPVVRNALAIHMDPPDRVRLGGPALKIGPKPALALALMLHELATNATKYGALSQAGGRVDIGWAVSGPAGEATLRLTWTETGGPAVTPPLRKGFGSRFIERGLSGQVGGDVEMVFDPAGLVCSVSGPLAAFQSDD